MNASLDEKLAQLKQAQDETYALSGREHIKNLDHIESKVWQRIESQKAQSPLFLLWIPETSFFQVTVKSMMLASIIGFSLGVMAPALFLPSSPNIAQEMLHFEIFKPQLSPIRFLTGSKSL